MAAKRRVVKSLSPLSTEHTFCGHRDWHSDEITKRFLEM
jgi:hypothetical protein